MATERKTSGAAVDRDAFPIAVDARARFGHLLKIELKIIGNEEVQIAVAVVIQKGASRTPAHFRTSQSSFLRDVFESTVSLVAVEAVLAIVGAENIFVSVVVVVADAHSIGPADSFKSRLFGYVGKGSISIVFVKSIRGFRRSAS